MVEGMNFVVKGMDRLAVTDLPTQLQGGPRPCPYKVLMRSAIKTNLYVGIWLHGTSGRRPKDSSCSDLPVPTSPLSQSNLLLLLPLQGPILHHTGTFPLFCRTKTLSYLESWKIQARLSEGYYQLGTWPDNIQDVRQGDAVDLK